MKVVEELLDLSGIGRGRMAVRWVSAAEGQLFADYAAELTRLTKELGPFSPDRYELPLAAVEAALKSTRLRWLMGMERQITERENVYHQKLAMETYQGLLSRAIKEEYEIALLLEVLREGPLSVREMAARTGMPVYTVSKRLNDLERTGQAELRGFEGTTPKFASLAA